MLVLKVLPLYASKTTNYFKATRTLNMRDQYVYFTT